MDKDNEKVIVYHYHIITNHEELVALYPNSIDTQLVMANINQLGLKKSSTKKENKRHKPELKQDISLSSKLNVNNSNLVDKPKSADNFEIDSELDILFTVKEFAKYFKVTEITARSWLKKGLIPFIRIGKRIRIRKSEILSLEKQRNKKM